MFSISILNTIMRSAVRVIRTPGVLSKFTGRSFTTSSALPKSVVSNVICREDSFLNNVKCRVGLKEEL